MQQQTALPEKISAAMAELIRSGLSNEKAAALAYSGFAADDAGGSARITDINGWYEVKRNPLSKAGVYPYLGRSIDPSGRMGLEPDKMYSVLRPPEELSDPECIESFKLIPWVVGHAMLGPEQTGYMPAEEKGVHGVTGEEVFFEGDTLYANIKWFSNSLDQIIASGTKELSMGYRCLYEIASGNFNGMPYDVVQRKIRGNHVALVPEGRMGPEVAVLDSMQFTFDARDIMAEETKTEEKVEGAEKAEMTLNEAVALLKEIIPQVKAMQDHLANMNASAATAADEDKKDEKKEEGSGMDAAVQIAGLQSQIEALKKDGLKTVLGEIAQRDALARQISSFVGAFDHADKTLAEVAAYGVEKFGLKCAKGQEIAALQGYLHNRTPEAVSTGYGHAVDAKSVKTAEDEISAYINSAA